MTSQPPSARVELLWQDLVEAAGHYYNARMAFFQAIRTGADAIVLLRAALRAPGLPRGEALQVVRYDEQLKRDLFPELIYLETWTHGFGELVRDVIVSMDRGWLEEHLPGAMDDVLEQVTGEDAAEAYLGYFDLLKTLDSPYLTTLREKAAASDDPEVRALADGLAR